MTNLCKYLFVTTCCNIQSLKSFFPELKARISLHSYRITQEEKAGPVVADDEDSLM